MEKEGKGWTEGGWPNIFDELSRGYGKSLLGIMSPKDNRMVDSPKKLSKLATVVVIGGLVSGCTYVTEGSKLGPISPPANSMKPFIEHTVGDYAFSLEGGKLVTANFAGKIINEHILDAWEARDYIRDYDAVDSGAFTGKADYNLTLNGSQYGESSIGMQILCGLTLFLIPYSVTQHYDIQYTLTEVQTGKSYTGSVEELNKVYVELFLLFALPFSAQNEQAMFERIGDHLYSQLHQQGAFQFNATKSTSDQ